MRTLDDVWVQFTANVQASVKVTTTGIEVWDRPRKILAVQLALCEAVADLIGTVPNRKECWPGTLRSDSVQTIRRMIRNPNPDNVRLTTATINEVFNWIVVLQARQQASSLQIDAVVALGWLGQAAIAVAAGASNLADDAGRNVFDAVLRILIRTGHTRSNLEALIKTAAR